MRLSEEQTQAVYDAIDGPITELHTQIEDTRIGRFDLNDIFRDVTDTIWRRVHAALKLEGEP